MTSQTIERLEQNRVAMAKERAARAQAYADALADVKALEVEVAGAPEDRTAARELDRADRRLETVLRNMEGWGDPLPGAPSKPSSQTGAAPAPVTPPPRLAPLPAAGSSFEPKQEPAANPIAAIAARILAA